MTPQRSSTRLRSTRGFILPLVILAMLVLTSLSLAAFALAGTESRATEWERSWVGERGVERSVPSSGLVAVAPLGGGFHLVAPALPMPAGSPSETAFDLRLHRVAWCLDPHHEAHVRPSLSDEPRIGPLAPSDLLALRGPGVEPAGLPGGVIALPHEVTLGRPPGEHGPVLVLAGEGGVLLVIASGNLVFRGGGRVQGVVVVEGEARWEGGVTLEGALWSGMGSVGDPPLTPSAPLARAALGTLPGCPVLLHDLGRIGRF